jgi:hypothetical protein
MRGLRRRICRGSRSGPAKQNVVDIDVANPLALQLLEPADLLLQQRFTAPYLQWFTIRSCKAKRRRYRRSQSSGTAAPRAG